MSFQVGRIEQRRDRELSEPGHRFERRDVLLVRKHVAQGSAYRLPRRATFEHQAEADQVHSDRTPSGRRLETGMLTHVRVHDQPMNVRILKLTVITQRHLAEHGPTSRRGAGVRVSWSVDARCDESATWTRLRP